MRNSFVRFYYTASDAGIVLSDFVDPADLDLVTELENKYYYNWILIADVSVNPWDTKEPERPILNSDLINQWEYRFQHIYNTTKDRYSTQLKLYREQSNKLLERVGGKSTTRFNDTPQNINTGENFEFTTTVSETNSEADTGDMIERLNRIHKLYKDLLSEWVKEFKDLFGTSVLL